PPHDGRMSATVAQLHAKAKLAISAGEARFREAAEHLAAARTLGASQRQSAKAIGTSQFCVSRLLQWRDGGCKGSPFEKRKPVQRDIPAYQKKSRLPTSEAQIPKSRADRVKAAA